MSFLFGARSQQPNKFGSIQVQTSEIGVAKPYAAGTVKLPFKLLDYVDFQANAQSAGGKGGGSATSYDYLASIDALLCGGPFDGIGNVYDSSGTSASLETTETFTVPSGGGTYTVSHSGADFQLDEGVTFPQVYSVTADDYGSDGTTTLNGTQTVPMGKVASGPSGGEYAVNITTGQYTFSGADAGKIVTITYTYIDNNTNPNPASKYNLTAMLGTYPQAPWGYMESMHPERALGYDGLARAVAENFDLGTSATPPNLSVECLNVRGLKFGGGIADCDPSRVLGDICGDARAGMAWPYLGDVTAYSNFCVANSLFISPSYDSQSKALSIIDNITKLTNSAPVWSGNALKIIPYGDTTAVGNGRTFSPNTQPVYQVDYSDIIADANAEPVLPSWPGLADNYNAIQFQYLRRDSSYNNDVINEKDEASILMNGLLPAQTVDGSIYQETLYASMAANMLLKRAAVPLRQWAFKLKWFYFLLEPMDIILVQRKPGAAYTPVRIVSVAENDDYSLSIVAEDFLYRVASGVQYPKGSGNGNGRGAHDLPGNTSLLALFQPNLRLTGGSNEVWAALGGGSAWGGCDVLLSLDGTTYKAVARQYGSSRAGVISAPIAAGSDPDTTNTLSVALSATLDSGTQQDADSYATLCLAGSELISYETATLTGSSSGTNSYDLTYLRRGIFANNSQSHAAGEAFVRLDNQVTKYVLDPSLVGKTVFLKFPAFNLYGLESQDWSTVPAYPFVVGSGPSAMNMTVSYSLNSGGADFSINVFKQGGAPGTAGSGTTSNGAPITLPAYTFTPEAASTTFFVNWSPVTSAYVLYTVASAWLADQQAGMLAIGSITTPATGGGGGGGSLVPNSYSDTGSQPTYHPDGTYNSANAPSEVVGSASSLFFASSHPLRNQSSTGICSWQGFSGTAPAAMTLRVTISFALDTGDNGDGSGHGSVMYTLDGSTWSNLVSSTSTLASATYTASVPSGTNLAAVQVQAAAYASCPNANAGADSRSGSMQVNVSAINIS